MNKQIIPIIKKLKETQKETTHNKIQITMKETENKERANRKQT